MNKYPIRFNTREAITEDVWTAARDACAAGVPIDIIARKAGIYKSWVEERAEAEKWMTPERREALLREYEVRQPAKVQEAIEDIAIATAALSSDKALIHRARIANLTSRKIEQAERTIAAPKTWKELQIADNMARKAHGLDEDSKPAAMVQLNLLSTTSTVEDA
jgi:replicative superfamily II helicase